MAEQHHKPEVKKQPEKGRPPKQKSNLLQVIQSVLSAIFGVQSNKNRERDFEEGDPANFIGVYIVIVVCIIVGMMLLVNSVIKEAGL